ncbi:MAG: TonB-dependent receptor domain-containing protein, partial [Gemmatimonadales bacterium]
TGEHQERFFPGAAVADAALYQGGRAWSRLAVANWGQRLGRFRGGLLHLHVNLSVGTDRLIVGALDAGSEAATRAPALGVQLGALRFTGLDVFPFPITDQTIRDIRTNSGLRGTPYFGRNDLETGQLGRLNPYGMATGWPTHGIGTASLTLVDERRWSGKWALEWRPGTHRLAVGGDADRVELSFYESASLIQQIGLNAFSATPKRWGLFAGDRVELGRLVIDAGIRYDHYTPGAEFPKTPGRIASVDSATAPPNGRQWNPAGATDDTAYANSVARVFDSAQGRGTLSPRVRLLYALTPRTNVRFAYGQQLEPPSFDRLLANVNSDLSFTSIFTPFGRDVRYGKVALVELGGRHALGRRLAVDVSVYRKNDLSPYVNRFRPFPDPAIPGDTLFINALTLGDGDHATGVDAKLDWRPWRSMQGSVSYSLIKTSPSEDGLADVTTQAIYAIANLGVPSGWKHESFIGLLGRDLGALLTFRATSGLPYTPLINLAEGVVAPGPIPLFGRPAGAINSEQLPWTHRLDLRLTKGLRVGRGAWTVYLDVRNLLNTTNVEALFAETGDVVNDLHRSIIVGFEQGFLWDEASLNGVLLAGNTVDLRVDCATWVAFGGRPFNCVSLRRVENRFGDGDGLYTVQEQERALNAAYDSFYSPPRFYGAGRTVRLGVA